MNTANASRMEIANRLRMAREIAGLSQSQVAKMMGLNRPSISEIEAGRRKVSTEELIELSKIYDVSINWLAGESNEDFFEDARIELAARELSKLNKKDLDRLMELLKALRTERDS